MASRHNTVTRQDGSVETLRVFRCLSCSRIYDDDDWQARCMAQPQKLGRPAQASGRGQRRDDLLGPHQVKIDYNDVPDALRAVIEAARKRINNDGQE